MDSVPGPSRIEKPSPFPGHYIDGLTGFYVRVNTAGFHPSDIEIGLHKSFGFPKKTTIMVRAEVQKQEPNISYGGLNWEFELPEVRK